MKWIWDRIFAALGVIVLAAYLAIVAIKLKRLDLGIMFVIGVTMAAYDLWLSLRPGGRIRNEDS
ncbi:MAG: hypothetical protein U1E56_13345 [Bauldia sp.]